MEKLIIDRQRWLRGEGPSKSCLLRAEDGKMCCLGFDLLRRGFTAEQITNVAGPESLGVEVPGLTHSFSVEGIIRTQTCEELMAFNDAAAKGMEDEVEGHEEIVADEAEREAKIVALYAGIGVEVEFVN